MSPPFTPQIVLYVWPGKWDLPSFDPLCIAAVLYLQYTIPGKYLVSECSNPDSSPSGQLPYIAHEKQRVSGFSSIIKYIAALQGPEYPGANLDGQLSPVDKAQRTAWIAHAESHLGNLVYYTQFSSNENWDKLVLPALAEMFPVPQKYYVPRRIRDNYYPRLSAAGFWESHVEKEPEKPFNRPDISKAKEPLKQNPEVSQRFEREKILDKARRELDLYRELLSGKRYLFDDRCTSADILIASHIIILANPPYPDASLRTIVHEKFPSLLSYSESIFNRAFEHQPPIHTTSTTFSIRSLLPPWPQRSAKKENVNAEDRQDMLLRWGFFGIVLGAFGAYLTYCLRHYTIVITLPQSGEEGEDAEEETEADTNVS